jgi:head-tail adaptor
MAQRTSAGKLDKKVCFDMRGPASGPDFGSPMGDWVEQFWTFGSLTHLRGSEPVIQSRLQGRQPVVVRVRDSTQSRKVTVEWRVRIGQTYYGVTAITPVDDGGDFIDFLCVTGGIVG